MHDAHATGGLYMTWEENSVLYFTVIYYLFWFWFQKYLYLGENTYTWHIYGVTLLVLEGLGKYKYLIQVNHQYLTPGLFRAEGIMKYA